LQWLHRSRKWTRLSLVMQVNIHEAKTHLSRLVERAAAGEEIIIGKAGKPVARLVPYKQSGPPERKPGSMRGKIKIKSGFEEMDQEIERMFLGEPD
jgi:prevent-host-death family protein